MTDTAFSLVAGGWQVLVGGRNSYCVRNEIMLKRTRANGDAKPRVRSRRIPRGE